jgi:hypothetical protein
MIIGLMDEGKEYKHQKIQLKAIEKLFVFLFYIYNISKKLFKLIIHPL